MRFLIPVFFALISFACTWQTDREPYRERLQNSIIADIVIDEYEMRFGSVSNRCKNHLQNIVYVSSDERIYSDSEFRLGQLSGIGEHYYDGVSYIWVDPNLTNTLHNTTIGHEDIHALLACVSDPDETGIGDNDPGHKKPDIWCMNGHGCYRDSDSDSLAYAIADMIRFYDNR